MRTSELMWSSFSGNEDALHTLADAFQKWRRGTGFGGARPIYVVTGLAGTGLTHLCLELESYLRVSETSILSVGKDPRGFGTSFPNDLVVALGIPGEPHASSSFRQGKSTLSPACARLIEYRSYHGVIIRDAEDWWRLDKRENSKSSLGIVELLNHCSSCAVAIFVKAEAFGWVTQSLGRACFAFETIELKPMAYDNGFCRFIDDVKSLIVPSAILPKSLFIEYEKIHISSRGRVGMAVVELKIALADLDISMWHGQSSLEDTQFEPLKNESFSSWLGRLSAETKNAEFIAAIDYFYEICVETSSDPDTLHQMPELRSHLNSAQLDTIDRCFHDLPSDCLPYSASSNYCPECLKSDIRAVKLPAWKVDWRRKHICVCCSHITPVIMESMFTPHYTPLDRAWRAFCEYQESPSSRLLVNFPLASEGHQSIEDNHALIELSARVQQWVVNDPKSQSPSQPEKNVIEFLLGVWLCDPSWRSAPGFACSFFFPQRKGNHPNLTDCLPSTSTPLQYSWATPRQLCVAYWMLGVAFEVISRTEAEFIRRVCRPYSLPFPVSRDEIKRVGLGVHGKKVRGDLVAHAREAFSGLSFDQVIWALE